MTMSMSQQTINGTGTKKPLRVRPKSTIMTTTQRDVFQKLPIDLSIQPSTSYNVKHELNASQSQQLQHEFEDSIDPQMLLVDNAPNFVPVAAEEADHLDPEWNNIMEEEIPNAMVNLDVSAHFFPDLVRLCDTN
jgi:hypothetical protein